MCPSVRWLIHRCPHPTPRCCHAQLFNSGWALGKLAAFLLDRVLGALLPASLRTAHARGSP